MEISGHGRAQDLATLLLGVKDADRPGPPASAPSGARQDEVRISDSAKEMQRIASFVDAPDAARAAQVERLRQALDNGTYNVDGRMVADAMIRQVLTDSVL
jgi:negative regulator of flagellin synthesis FlgM